MKIIPAEYKIADDIKKSPKGYTITIERIAGQKSTNHKPAPKEPTKKEANKSDKEVGKSKKKTLDDLLEAGMV